MKYDSQMLYQTFRQNVLFREENRGSQTLKGKKVIVTKVRMIVPPGAR